MQTQTDGLVVLQFKDSAGAVLDEAPMDMSKVPRITKASLDCYISFEKKKKDNN